MSLGLLSDGAHDFHNPSPFRQFVFNISFFNAIFEDDRMCYIEVICLQVLEDHHQLLYFFSVIYLFLIVSVIYFQPYKSSILNRIN